MIVYHLSEAKWALDNVNRKRIKIAEINDLNDPFELTGPDLKNKVQRKHFKEWRKKIAKKYGVVCFSRSWENPVLWSHYAEKHKGIALGFEVLSENLNDVIYTSTRLPSESVKNAFSAEEEKFLKRLLMTKYMGWAYEDEVRIFVSLKESIKSNGKYFLPFSTDLVLREIIVGPLCRVTETKLKKSFEKYSKKIILTKARLAFRSFRVVKNKMGFRA